MKNWMLFGVLAGLLTLAYFTEELSRINSESEALKKQQLYDSAELGEVQGFQTPEAKLMKGHGVFFTARHYKRVDPETLNRVFSIIGGIRAKRFLSKDEIAKIDRKIIFPDAKRQFSFFFKETELRFLVGAKLEFDRAFYLEVENVKSKKKQVVVAFDSTADEGASVKGTEHRSGEKHGRLLALLELPEKFFYDRHLFIKLSKGKENFRWKNVSVSNIRNRPFTVELATKSTKPTPFVGINYWHDYFDKFFHDLKMLESSDLIYPYSADSLEDQVSIITIDGFDKTSHRLTLYKKFNGRSGYFVSTTFNENLYEMNADTASFFFLSAQEFWDKRIISDEQLLGRRHLDFFVGFDDKLFDLQLPAGKKFNVVIKDPNSSLSPNIGRFKKLFEFIARQGDRVADWNQKKSEIDMLDKASFYLVIDGDKIYVYFDKSTGELMLINSNKSFLLSYYVGDDPEIGLDFVDYFFKK